jgi:hypothetical protein
MNDDFAIRRHDHWLEHPMVLSYHTQPGQKIDDNHIADMDQLINNETADEEDQTTI